MLTNIDLVIYGVATFFTAIVSGIAGGGGGFVTTPLAIFLGLSPAQAVASGKIGGLAISVSSLQGMKGVKVKSKKQLAVIMVMAFVIGAAAPFFITRLDSELYRTILGVLILLMIPVIMFKKVGQSSHQPTSLQTALGYGSLVFAFALQAVFSGGMGSLVNLALMGFIGMTALEANVTKRYSQLILNSVIVIGVLFTGLIYWPIVLVGVVASYTGGFIGGKLAVKRGNKFVITVFVILMFGAAMELLFG